MVFGCAIWSFGEIELGDQVILSDKRNRARNKTLYLADGVSQTPD